jgi:hypothetical protein
MTNTNHSLGKGQSDEHYTPKHLFDALKIVFDLDVASPPNGSNVPAVYYYDKSADGLVQKWFGNVWMNPPYSNPTPWVDRFIIHKQGIALLPVTRGKWWDRLWNSECAIMPLIYNFAFERPEGLKPKPIVFRTALYAYGETNITALQMSGLGVIR